MGESTLPATANRPPVFIGSSSEGLDIANTLQVLLQRFCDPMVWPQGLFEPGRSYLESLVGALPGFDFAVLVISPDDIVQSRGASNSAPRDNVLFELGLFMGRLGRDRTFAVYDRTRDFKLPSDFAGIKLIDYEPSRHGLEAALGPVATQIAKAIKKAGPQRTDTDRKLDVLQQTVIASGEIGPSEQAFFDKFSQLVRANSSANLALLYADIDGLRSVTRQLFLAEKSARDASKSRAGRRPEEAIRADFVNALNVSVTDAVYQLHRDGLKHDIFALPDPDIVVVGRKLSYEAALQVARRTQDAFREEAAHLAAGTTTEPPSVTLLVTHLSLLENELTVKGPAELHRFLRSKLKQLKETGRGSVYEGRALK